MTPINTTEAAHLFQRGLKNLHAVETNCRTMTQRQIGRTDDFPNVKERLEEYLATTEAQLQRLELLLEKHGESPSSMKDAMAGMGANMSAMGNAMADDEILKNSMANAAMVMMQVAAYDSTIALGSELGDIDAVRTLQLSLNEERDMHAWLAETMRGVTMQHLQLRSQGLDARS